MSQIAVCVGNVVIYWSSIVIFLGATACFAYAYSLYTANGGKKGVMWAILPLTVVLGVLFSRLIHWYCHSEQYTGLLSAITDYSAGDYCLPGVFIGAVVAVLLVKALRLTDDAGFLFDSLAAAAPVGVAIIRLSALFNNSCRGKIIVETEAFQRLPFASPVSTANGAVEYRFATFFAEFLVMLVLFFLIGRLYRKRRDWPMKEGVRGSGHVALLFLAMYGATQVILDSTRYDSSFLPANGFVSLVQILGAAALIGVMVYYTVVSVKTNGFGKSHVILWVLFLAAAGGAGFMEYLVQRYGNLYLPVYAGMTVLLIVMYQLVKAMYRSVCRSKEEKKALDEQKKFNPALQEEPALATV